MSARLCTFHPCKTNTWVSLALSLFAKLLSRNWLRTPSAEGFCKAVGWGALVCGQRGTAYRLEPQISNHQFRGPAACNPRLHGYIRHPYSCLVFSPLCSPPQLWVVLGGFSGPAWFLAGRVRFAGPLALRCFQRHREVYQVPEC